MPRNALIIVSDDDGADRRCTLDEGRVEDEFCRSLRYLVQQLVSILGSSAYFIWFILVSHAIQLRRHVRAQRKLTGCTVVPNTALAPCSSIFLARAQSRCEVHHFLSAGPTFNSQLDSEGANIKNGENDHTNGAIGVIIEPNPMISV